MSLEKKTLGSSMANPLLCKDITTTAAHKGKKASQMTIVRGDQQM